MGQECNIAELQLRADGRTRIMQRFPLLVSESEGVLEEAFKFLFDVGVVRGSTHSGRTLSTYAESLLSWLSYAEEHRLPWRRPTVSMLAGFRDHMLGTTWPYGCDRRALAPRTVNLRLTVAISFYEYLGWISATSSRRDVPVERNANAHSAHRTSKSAFHRLRVRVYSRRPRATRVVMAVNERRKASRSCTTANAESCGFLARGRDVEHPCRL